MIETKDYGEGVFGRVYYDEDAESPIADAEGVKLCVLHRNYINPAPECGDTPEALETWARRNRSWEGFKVWLFDHSGTVYQIGETNPFSCPWDSGRVGVLFMRKREWPKATREASAREIMRSYTTWANGSCLRYDIVRVTEYDDDELLDSCGGFYDMDTCLAEMDDAAAFHVSDEREAAAQAMADAIQEARPDMDPAVTNRDELIKQHIAAAAKLEGER